MREALEEIQRVHSGVYDALCATRQRLFETHHGRNDAVEACEGLWHSLRFLQAYTPHCMRADSVDEVRLHHAVLAIDRVLPSLGRACEYFYRDEGPFEFRVHWRVNVRRCLRIPEI